VSSDKALACVGDKGEYQAPGSIITDAEFAVWTDSADDGAKTWLLTDRDKAGELCPDAAQDREYWRWAWSAMLRLPCAWTTTSR
jgi:hypothetical protein